MRIWCRENIIVKKSFYLTFCMPWKICGEIWGNMFFWLFSNFGPQTLMMCRNFYTNQPKMTKCLNDFLHQMILKKNVFSYTEGGCTYNIFPFEDFWILVKLHKFSFHFKLTYRQVCPDILYIRGYHSRYPCPVFPGKEGGYLEQIFLLGISLLKNFPALPAGGK